MWLETNHMVIKIWVNFAHKKSQQSLFPFLLNKNPNKSDNPHEKLIFFPLILTLAEAPLISLYLHFLKLLPSSLAFFLFFDHITQNPSFSTIT